MPAALKTIKVFSKIHGDKQVIINESDFNPSVHYTELPKVAPKPKRIVKKVEAIKE